MTYDLHIAEKAFSSWSLRGWLMFTKFGIPCRIHMAGLYTGTFKQDLATLPPARTVPVMRTPDGIVVGDTLAMAETLAERHPDAGLWPADPAQRALARWLAAEMHSSFTALRSACPMQLLHIYHQFQPSDAVLADLARLDLIWSHARKVSGSKTPWLFGDYSVADAFFAPVAARIKGFALPVSDASRAYVEAHLTDPAFRQWCQDGQKVSYDPEPYALDLPKIPWVCDRQD